MNKETCLSSRRLGRTLVMVDRGGQAYCLGDERTRNGYIALRNGQRDSGEGTCVLVHPCPDNVYNYKQLYAFLYYCIYLYGIIKNVKITLLMKGRSP